MPKGLPLSHRSRRHCHLLAMSPVPRSASRSIFAAISKESGELHIDAIANFPKPFWTAEQIDRADNMRGDQNGEKINKSHAEPFQHVKRRD